MNDDQAVAILRKSCVVLSHEYDALDHIEARLAELSADAERVTTERDAARAAAERLREALLDCASSADAAFRCGDDGEPMRELVREIRDAARAALAYGTDVAALQAATTPVPEPATTNQEPTS